MDSFNVRSNDKCQWKCWLKCQPNSPDFIKLIFIIIEFPLKLPYSRLFRFNENNNALCIKCTLAWCFNANKVNQIQIPIQLQTKIEQSELQKDGNVKCFLLVFATVWFIGYYTQLMWCERQIHKIRVSADFTSDDDSFVISTRITISQLVCYCNE